MVENTHSLSLSVAMDEGMSDWGGVCVCDGVYVFMCVPRCVCVCMHVSVCAKVCEYEWMKNKNTTYYDRKYFILLLVND